MLCIRKMLIVPASSLVCGGKEIGTVLDWLCCSVKTGGTSCLCDESSKLVGLPVFAKQSDKSYPLTLSIVRGTLF